MKKLKIGLSVLAVLIGAGSVLASNAATASANRMQQTYTWDHYDQSGTLIGTVPNLTEQQARDMFGCPGTTGTKCAVAEEAPNLIIHYQQ